MKKELDKKTLTSLYIKEQKTLSEIAKTFGCSPGTVLYRCKKYGIATKPVPPRQFVALNKEVLYKLYVKEQKSTNEIAKMFSCTPTTVQNKCRKYKIKLRPRTKEIKGLNKPTLQKLYVQEGKSMKEIAEMFSCSPYTVKDRFRKYGIARNELSREVLQQLYVKDGKTIREIAEILNCSRETVRRRCKQFGIPLRNPGTKRKINEATLRRLYLKEKRDISEIARRLGCALSTVSNGVKRFGLRK